MKLILWISVVVFSSIAIYVFSYFYKTPAADPVVVVTDAHITAENKDFGFLFQYQGGEDGYIVAEENTKEDAVVFSESVFSVKDYDQYKNEANSIKPSASLGIKVFANPTNLLPKEWVIQNGGLYFPSKIGTTSYKQLGATNFLTFKIGSNADYYLFARNGYLYMFTNVWKYEQGVMKKDMEELVSSIIWTTPAVPSVEQVSDIRVTNVHAQDKIKSPLSITGFARGTWFFEASFPVELRNQSGTTIATAIAHADGDWMTEDFVPFSVTLIFDSDVANQSGVLVLKKDNPSGLPKNDSHIEIPVVLAP